MTIFNLVTNTQSRVMAEMESWAKNGAGGSFPLVNMTPERSRDISREMAQAMRVSDGYFVLSDD